MSIQEIEQAITHLSSKEVDRLAEWLAGFRAKAVAEQSAMNGHGAGPVTLADAMGDLLGAVGRETAGAMTSSRDAGQALTNHLVDKKREQRL